MSDQIAGVLVLILAFALCACAKAQDKEAAPANAGSEAEQPGQEDTKPEKAQEPAEQEPDRNVLLSPSDPAVNKTAPESFQAKFETSNGTFIVQVTRSWAPHGADRVYNLVANGFYDGCHFFRVLSGFVAQFGMHGDPAVSSQWTPARIPDDPVKVSNKRGTVTFAMAGKDTRTTQLFINYRDNGSLDGMGFSPIGEVIEGMSVVDALYSEYGEGAPRGKGPSQGRINAEGNKYLEASFPKLDYVKKATIVP